MVTTYEQHKEWIKNHPNYHKEYYAENREKRLNSKKKWYSKTKDSGRLIPMRKRWERNAYKKGTKDKEYYFIRQRTRKKYGKLKKGYVYHHSEPFKEDNFMILEDKFHRWYHGNMNRMIENKKKYGRYQI